MLPHKIKRGKNALKNLKVYEGCPQPYERQQRFVVPRAMRIACLRPGRPYCNIGRLSTEVGWKYQEVINVLETKRKAKGCIYAAKKKQAWQMTKRAEKITREYDFVKPYVKIMNDFGYK